MGAGKGGLLTCMGDLDGPTGQRRAEPHAFWLIVGVEEPDFLAFVRHAALGKFEARITDSARVGVQSVMALQSTQLRQTCVPLHLAFKLNFDFVGRQAGD